MAQKTFIVKISGKVKQYYDALMKGGSASRESAVSILKCNKTRPEGLKNVLNHFKQSCVSARFCDAIDNMMIAIDGLVVDGDAKKFIHFTTEGVKTKFEFVCCVVRKYRYNGEEVCDYCLASYTFAKEKGNAGTRVVAGTGTIVSALAFGAFALVTGGTGPVIFGGIAGVCSVIGTIVTTDALLDKKKEEALGETLEASFIYEIVRRGYAEVNGNFVYLTNE